MYHQDTKFINESLENLKKYNKLNNYLVIMHLSDKLYNLKDHIKLSNNILINPDHFNKKPHTHLILKAHIINCNYLVDKKIEFSNFVPLSSRCYFVCQSPKFLINEYKIVKNEIQTTLQQLIEKIKTGNRVCILKRKLVMTII